MRAYRKKPWSSLMVNMTPLIDVVFLMIIFFIMMMNFSEILIRKIVLPKADQAKKNVEQIETTLYVTVKSQDLVFVGRRQVALGRLEEFFRQTAVYPHKTTVELRGDENITYDVVQKVLEKIASAGITRIEFAARKDSISQDGEAHAQ